MSRHGMASPVTPMWAQDQRSQQRMAQRTASRLLPSAIEMTTPPNTIPRPEMRKRKADAVAPSAGAPIGQPAMEYRPDMYAPPVPLLSTPERMRADFYNHGMLGYSPIGDLAYDRSPLGSNVSPTMVPNGAPGMVPMASMSNMVPNMAPGMAGNMAGNMAPANMPNMAPNVSPNMAAKAMPKMNAAQPMLRRRSGNYSSCEMASPEYANQMMPQMSYFQPMPKRAKYEAPAAMHGGMLHAPNGQPAIPGAGPGLPGVMQQPEGISRSMPAPPVAPAPRAAPQGSLSLAIPKRRLFDGDGDRDPYGEYNHYIMRHATDVKANIVWHPEVEVVFMEALWLIPGEPTRIVISQRARGRNELISGYLKSRLGEHRSRKQVSSHLQVLKKLLQHDEVFLDLVGPAQRKERDDQRLVKSKPVLEAHNIDELMVRLRELKRYESKPQFLIEAETNAELARSASAGERLPQIRVTATSMADQAAAGPPHEIGEPRTSEPRLARLDTETSNDGALDTDSMSSSSPDMSTSVESARGNLPTPVSAARVNDAKSEYPPILHPRPLPVDHKVEPLIAPSASVPPQEAQKSSSQWRARHRRTTSASVELSGDKVLPIQFTMLRRALAENEPPCVYSRLLRAAYESPLRPLKLSPLLPEFPDLASLATAELLQSVPVVHASVSICIGPPQEGSYASDVQYMLSGAPTNAGHRYFAKTVITSRKELLRCQFACPFQQISGRGLEEDKDILNVPFLPDFWDDFLRRLEVSGRDYARASLAALKMFQAVYRADNNGEELAFVVLSRFSVADDEFSARTRFRRVNTKALNDQTLAPQPVLKMTLGPDAKEANSGRREQQLHGSSQEHDLLADHTRDEQLSLVPASESKLKLESPDDAPATPTRGYGRLQKGNAHRRTDSALFAQLLGTPTPRRNSDPQGVEDAEPKPGATPKSLLPTVLDTPGRALLGGNFMFDSPSAFASPHRFGLDTFGSPFPSHIQRPMTAFEPQAWEEMHDWIWNTEKQNASPEKS